MKRIQIKRFTLLLFCAALCAVPIMVLAQQSTLEILFRACAEIDHDRQRLACYDQVLRPIKLGAPAQSPSAAETWEATQPVVPAELPPTSSVVEETSVVKEAPAVNEAPVVEDTFGLENKRSKDKAVRTIFVTELKKNTRNKYLFKTEDGQVWQQTDERSVHYDRAPFSAVIRTASLGSFYLKPSSSSVSIKVKRIK